MLFERPIDVLVVEDNPGDSRLIEINLSEQTDVHFRVVVRSDLAGAMEALGERAFGVVLLDLFLPDSQGLSTLERLIAAVDETPVVVMSGLDDFSVAVQAVQRGAQDYLVKGKGDGELIRRSILHAIERQRTRRQLLLSEAAFNNTDTGMLVMDTRGVVSRVNPAYLEVMGCAAGEVEGKSAHFLLPNVHDQDFYDALWARLKEEGSWEGEIWNRRRDGQIRPEWIRINVVRDGLGQAVGYVVIFSDVTFRRRAEDELIRQATTDSLTGLPNRPLFLKLLASGIERNRRYGRQLSLLFVDLDGFKDVNDNQGHDVGDLVLKEVALRLRRAVRVSDEVARLGGDEFTVVLSEVNQPHDAEAVAIKVVDALSQPYEMECGTLLLSASVGVATCPKDGMGPEHLLHAADEAMYKAKRAGKNRFVFADLGAEPL
ncbi:diguanylate cyclase domain-containing protein [Rhodospirillum sp. A1_3_36]|uniref:diguanylate cyclase domain-containing protein n=1 Tax=Rhodospirillum sp. A1_3_36 TaxID=3391666 RepID=UPI0039A78298